MTLRESASLPENECKPFRYCSFEDNRDDRGLEDTRKNVEVKNEKDDLKRGR